MPDRENAVSLFLTTVAQNLRRFAFEQFADFDPENLRQFHKRIGADRPTAQHSSDGWRLHAQAFRQFSASPFPLFKKLVDASYDSESGNVFHA